MCAAYQPAEEVGRVASPRLSEISGAAGGAEPETVWVHNDSGDGPRIYALGLGGDLLATIRLRPAQADDWEDMAVGLSADGTTNLYVGDIGDRGDPRRRIDIYRLALPAARDGEAPVDRMVVEYPDGPHDAEALLADGDDLYIVTKSLTGRAAVYATGPFVPGERVASTVGELDLGLGSPVTAGDLSADGSLVALRSYRAVWMWQRAAGRSVAETLQGEPCRLSVSGEGQGEALAFLGRDFVTLSEGDASPIHLYRHRR